jgi:4-hydroxybenzoate polyprenyltransferase
MKTALFVVLFVIASIIACVLLPFLAVQYPILFVIVVAAGVYVFSQTFKQRKKFQ